MTNIISLPSPFLSKFRHRERDTTLILVGAIFFLFTRRLVSGPKGTQTLDCRQNKVDFLKNLDPKVLKKTIYKPYFNERGALQDKEYIKKLFPDLTMCEGRENVLHKMIQRCRLVVVDHPSTTFSICMAGNIPVIGFWKDEYWPIKDEATPYTTALFEAGVVFRTGKEAAQQVNKVWDDVQGWWAEIQPIRKAFSHRYARTSKFWRFEWIKSLWKV